MRPTMSGWLRRRGSKTSTFHYVDESGKRISSRSVLDRIERLRIPPGWRDVHIATSARASIQAWGCDARGRKQYRYHAAAVAQGELRKYHRVRRMGHALPTIRRRVLRDFHGSELTRERVTAAAVRLIAEAFFRVGSERYERENRSFGLTTLRKSHASLDGDRITFRYRGKSGIEQRQVVCDRDLARVVGRLRRAPGTRLFRYRDDGGWKDLTARDVNDYLRSLGDGDGVVCTAKDFRTWGGTLRLATVLGDLGPPASQREASQNVALALRLVAAELGNTPAICRRSYVHPMVIAQYVDDGVTIEPPRASGTRRSHVAHSPEERALLRFLDRYFPDQRRRPRAEERRAVRRRVPASGARS